jgi:putative SOS response-associated peptidase YedK
VDPYGLGMPSIRQVCVKEVVARFVWEAWADPQGREIRTYTIITTEPNELMAPIHNRMPAILRREDEEAWLRPDVTESHT